MWRSQHIAELNQRAVDADMRLKRLYDAIEAGSLDPAESALGERIASLTALPDQARADAEKTEAMLKSSAHQDFTGAAVRRPASEARIHRPSRSPGTNSNGRHHVSMWTAGASR